MSVALNNFLLNEHMQNKSSIICTKLYNKLPLLIILCLSTIALIASNTQTENSFSASAAAEGTITNSSEVDKFGIQKIYPTKQGGREWFLNMDNPLLDNNFAITFSENITRQDEGSWNISGRAVRLNVNTPPGLPQWKNVEITGYAKINEVLSDTNSTVKDEDLSWYARGGRHNTKVPCEATAYIGGIYVDGSVGWKKEIWFIGGYTDEKGADKVTTPILGRWIGWKVIIYNINNDTAVKLESYIDNTNTNFWIKVSDLVDDGGWYSKSNDAEFYSAGCDRDKDFVVTNGGPVVTFRSDNLTWEFKDLSIREIDPGTNTKQASS
jgi:hypothetical protein